jgi:DNA polymerase-3 subunit gamma/tau
VRFIFATTEGDKVLATIVSRCQRFDLRRIQTDDIVNRLKKVCENEGVQASDDALLAIGRGAEGGMRDALSSLDQLISFKGSKIEEEDALGVFGLISRSALESLASSILSGDVGAILSAIETFDSAGKNMRGISTELLAHFRNLAVLQALGPTSPSLAVTADQAKVLAEQARGIDSSRIFRICDLLAETEDKLRYALSVRTLIELSLIRASRIASTATVEELMKAVRALKSSPEAVSQDTPPPAAPPPVAPPQVAPSQPTPGAEPQPKKDGGNLAILDDPAVERILSSVPGAAVVGVKRAGNR